MEDLEEEEDNDDFNFVIKEYNKTFVTTEAK